MKWIRKNLNFNFLQGITLLFLLCAGMNLLGKYQYFCFIAVIIFILFRNSFVFDVNVLFLIILSLSWVCFAPEETFNLLTLVKPFIYPAMYVVGRNFFQVKLQNKDGDFKQKNTISILIIISTGPFIHYLLNFFKNINSTSRNTVDVWNDLVFSATGQAALACMMVAITISLLFMSTKLHTKVLSAIGIVLITMYNLVLSGRTLFVLMALVLLACFVFTIKQKRSFGKKAKMVYFAVFVIICAYFVLAFNIFGAMDYIVESNLFHRFTQSNEEITETGRIAHKLAHLNNFGIAVLGGAKIRDLGAGYAHDLFLDTYDEAGIFALVATIFFVGRSVYVLFKIIQNERFGLDFRIMTLSIYIAFLAEFLVEPIIQGLPWFFALYCFTHGLYENIHSDDQKNNLYSRVIS